MTERQELKKGFKNRGMKRRKGGRKERKVALEEIEKTVREVYNLAFRKHLGPWNPK